VVVISTHENFVVSYELLWHGVVFHF